VLAGVAVRGTPVAGVIGLPFLGLAASERNWLLPGPTARHDLHGIVYGIVGTGIFGLPSLANEPTDDRICVAISRGSTSPLLNGLLGALSPDRVLELSGCGNKALAVLTGEAHAAV
jgi:hypothetical protein